ncbi:MAG: type IV pilus modification protein PilV [Acidiferrobacterales bacterium]
MQPLHLFSSKHGQRQCGFSLIEVLVALLVLSIGLLGLAGLQTLGLKFNTQSYQRTQAVLNAYEIIDRIRANRGGMLAGEYDNISLSFTPPVEDCTIGGNCNTTQMANYDIGQWKTSLTNLLAQGQGGICRGTLDLNPFSCTVDATRTQFTVGIAWLESDIPMSLTVEAQL